MQGRTLLIVELSILSDRVVEWVGEALFPHIHASGLTDAHHLHQKFIRLRQFNNIFTAVVQGFSQWGVPTHHIQLSC